MGEPSPSDVAPVIPDHALLRPIGRGAYGEVWLARNVMGMLRAVKIIWRRQFESKRPYDREFAGIQRFEPVSRSSGGLVHVLHVGRNDAAGYFYYVMELADAVDPSNDGTTGDDYRPRTLRSDMNHQARLPTADCLRLALDVLGGLARLHLHGLVHRDVKPGNVIYVNGRAKLADIGLVSVGNEKRTFVGTEGYIPPEGPGSPSADLYALGITLYEASTGHPPERFPDVPTEWMIDDDVGAETLEFHEIVLKACEGRRERRYATAEAMQADLALLQGGRSLRRVRAAARRHARLRLAGVIGVVLFACMLVAALIYHDRAQLAAENYAREARVRAQIERSLARAESAEREAGRQLYTALLGEARAVVRSGELGQRVKALASLRRAAAISNHVELRREVFAALALPDLQFEHELSIGPNVTQARCDPAFERIALCRGAGSVEIRSLEGGALLASLPAGTNLPAYVAFWSDDGRHLAVKRDHPPGGQRADWEVWDVGAQHRRMLIQDLRGESLAFHPRSNLVVTAQGPTIVLRHLESGLEVARHPVSHEPRRLEVSADGQLFATVHVEDGRETVTVLDSARGAITAAWTFSDFVGDVRWHPDGQRLAVADHGGKVQLLDCGTGAATVLGRHKTEAVTLAFAPGGEHLISGGWEREMICWDLRTRQRAFTMGMDSYHLQFSADGRRCATLVRSPVAPGHFLQLNLHTFERPAAHREIAEDLENRLERAAFSPDGRWLGAAGQKQVGVWNLLGPSRGRVIEAPTMTRLEFTPDGANLFGSSLGGECHWWRLTTDDAPAVPQFLPRGVPERNGFNSVCVVSNQVVWTGAAGSRLQPISAAGSEAAWTPTASGLNGASPDGRWLGIHGRFAPRLDIYRLPELTWVAALTNRAGIQAFAFSPAADELAVSTRLGVELWDTGNWERTRELTGFKGILYGPDGRTLWLTENYRTAGLFDARTLRPLMPLPTGMLPLALSADGRWLAVSVDSRKLQVWDVTEVRRQLAGLGLDWQD